MERNSKVVLVLLLAIYYVSAFSQVKEWTLKECIDYALSHNLQIKQQILTTQSVHAEYMRSRMDMFPSLAGSGSHGLNYGKNVDPYSYEFTTENIQSGTFGLNAQVNLFSGLQVHNTIRKNRFLSMAAKADADRLRDEISLTIAQAYLQILLYEELNGITRQQIEIIQQQVERTKKLVDAGNLARGNMLDVEAQKALEELNGVNSQNQLDLAFLQLAQLLDIDSTENFRIARPVTPEPDTTLLSLSPVQVFNLAVSARPEIKSAEYQVEASLKGFAAARGMRLPQIGMSGSIGTGYSSEQKKISGITYSGYDTIGYTASGLDAVLSPSYYYTFENTPFGKQLDENFSQSIRFSLSIPLFTNWQVKTAVARAKIESARARNNLELARKQLLKTIQQAHADAKAAMLKYKASKKAASAMQESFNYTDQKFNLGMTTSFEYNQAKTKLAKAESDLLQAKYEFIFRVKVLEFYQGKALQ